MLTPVVRLACLSPRRLADARPDYASLLPPGRLAAVDPNVESRAGCSYDPPAEDSEDARTEAWGPGARPRGGLASEPAGPAERRAGEGARRRAAGADDARGEGRPAHARRAAIAFGGAPGPEEALRKGGAGSVLWVNDTKRFNALQKIAVEESRLKIPLLFGLDVIHGYRTIFPIPIGMAASWDPSVHERAAEVAAREARAAGIHWTFAPMVDIARDARWGRIAEGAGEDPYLGAAMAAAQVRGFQGPYLGAPDRLLACAKHFAAYGAADGGRDYDPVYVSEGAAAQRLLPALRGRGQGGRRLVHERLHGPERRAGGRQPVAAARRAARASGASPASW